MASGDSGNNPSKAATVAMGRGCKGCWPAVYCPRQLMMAEMSFYLLWP